MAIFENRLSITKADFKNKSSEYIHRPAIVPNHLLAAGLLFVLSRISQCQHKNLLEVMS